MESERLHLAKASVRASLYASRKYPPCQPRGTMISREDKDQDFQSQPQEGKYEASQSLEQFPWVYELQFSMDIWLIHGAFGCIALIMILPLGVVKLWFKNRQWPVSHWAIQSLGTIVIIMAAALGLLGSGSLHHTHQALGLTVSLMVLMQMVLGHANTLRSHSGTTYTHVAHSALGLVTFLLGWLTMLSGFRLASVASTPFIIFSVLSAIEIIGLVGGTVVLRWRGQIAAEHANERARNPGLASELYNLVEDESGEDEDSSTYTDKTHLGRQSTTVARKTPVSQ